MSKPRDFNDQGKRPDFNQGVQAMSDGKSLEAGQTISVAQTEIESIIGAADEIRQHALEQASRLDDALQRLSPEARPDGAEPTGLDKPAGALMRLRQEHDGISGAMGDIEASISRLCRLA